MSLVFKNKKREGKGVVQDLLYMLLIPLVTLSLYGNNTSLDFCEGGGEIGFHLQEELKT